MRDGARFAEELYNNRDFFPDDEAPKPFEVRHRNRPVQLDTLFGKIKLRRSYYHHTPSGTGRAPLDQRLDVQRGCTPAVARLMCRAASQSGSFAHAADDLHVYACLKIEARRIGRLSGEVAPLLEEALASLPAAPSTTNPAPCLTSDRPAAKMELPPIPVLYVSCDGTGVPMRREALAGRVGRQEDGSARTREAKLACVFTQTIRDTDGQPVRDPGSTSYVGTFEGCRQVGILLHQEAQRRGLARAQKVVFLGDGAAWIWENSRLTFPGAVEILDFYHACEHVGQLARAFCDEDPLASAQLQSKWCHQMKNDSPAAFLPEISVQLQANPLWPENKRSAIQSEIDYLQTHAARTRYGDYRAAGLFIGSGVIEAGCKTVIGRRLKQSGMFWSEQGAQDILNLRCLTTGPHFLQTWSAGRQIRLLHQRKNRRWSPPHTPIAA